MPNLLIGCTGSVASLKLPELSKQLLSFKGLEIKIVVTEHAKHFFNVEDIPEGIPIYDDNNEWSAWKGRGDPVLHIELGKWADLFLIAPLDANTLAKVAVGLCDNLLTCIARAWDPSKPLLFCPAMNTKMWQHPVTNKHICSLKEFGYTEIPVVAKTLICGDTGLGAMAEVDTIVSCVNEHFIQLS